MGLTDEDCLRKAGDAIERRQSCAFKAADLFTSREKREEKQARGDGCRREGRGALRASEPAAMN